MFRLVEAAYIETSGEMTVFFLPEEKVTYGLPVLPELYESPSQRSSEEGIYFCGYCGYTEEIKPTKKYTRAFCKKQSW
jgi:uncharacterized membrane protein YcaP (DUF421 family)